MKEKLSYHQKSGFNVPADYFEDLEEKIFKASLENRGDKFVFNNTKVNSGFKVPLNYFEALEKDLLPKKKSKVISLPLPRTVWYAAAIAAVFITIGSFWYFKNTSNSWDSVQLSAMEEYIGNEYAEFSPEDLSGFLDENSNLINEADFKKVSPNEVEAYIEDNLEEPSYTYILENY